MALFRRRSNAAAASTANPVEEAEPTREGPYDIADVPETGGRLNLGALHIPPRPGMQLRIELDKNTKVPNSVTCTLGRSSVQIQLFAAPRSLSLWDDVRPLIAESARDKNGSVDDVPGVFGRELLVKLPVTTPGGSGTKSGRFAGI
ncbi:MAG: DUF3710 domain-containing protein, partial [Ruaniaceae bacterium]|nr:DUF3710 domain-containing protein [Ruaniaceae bacterium]